MSLWLIRMTSLSLQVSDKIVRIFNRRKFGGLQKISFFLVCSAAFASKYDTRRGQPFIYYYKLSRLKPYENCRQASSGSQGPSPFEKGLVRVSLCVKLLAKLRVNTSCWVGKIDFGRFHLVLGFFSQAGPDSRFGVFARKTTSLGRNLKSPPRENRRRNEHTPLSLLAWMCHVMERWL